MSVFLITIKPNSEERLKNVGLITHKSITLPNFYIIESSLTRKDLEILSFVKEVEEDYIGHLYD